MPHIDLPAGYPGIRSLFMFSPVTAQPLNNLVQTLLHDVNSSTLTPGERELIATFTSSLNTCKYCTATHGAIAKYHFDGNEGLVNDVINDFENAAVSPKMKALLKISARVQKSGKEVTTEDIGFAKSAGATDNEIHDAVLITAAFCMFNRYVDGLATLAPDDPELYDAIGRQRSSEGYLTAVSDQLSAIRREAIVR